MRSPNRIDIQRFHEPQILLYIGERNGCSLFRVKIMAVDAAEFYGLSVKQILSVTDFYGPDTDFFKNSFSLGKNFQIV